MESQSSIAEDDQGLFAIWSEAQILRDLEGSMRSGRLVPLFIEPICASLPSSIHIIHQAARTFNGISLKSLALLKPTTESGAHRLKSNEPLHNTAQNYWSHYVVRVLLLIVHKLLLK